MNFQIVEVPFTSAQRPDVIVKTADPTMASDGAAIRDVTWIKIERAAGGNWAIGGQAVHARAIRRRAKRDS